mmetsp:Transcript_30148/g.41742  ORF Transcript_30148/g.41742 Transcript_30148/m.41742 type:complete len:249 (+) Transcript_30148:2-748(+)
MLIRIAAGKYGRDVGNLDLCAAFSQLIENNLLPNIPPVALTDNNVFRTERLYKEHVDDVYKKHIPVLKALYSRYRLPPKGGGLRKKVLFMDGWMELMENTGLIDESFTILEARLCFLWSRMKVVEEIMDYERYTALTFVDFLEALGRVADTKMIPTDEELTKAGYSNRYAWYLEDKQSPTESIPRRSSARLNGDSKRPLHKKIEGLLEIIFRCIWYDPAGKGQQSTDQEFEYESLASTLVKVDKSLGP